MFCKSCGKELQDDWKKCPFCGSEGSKNTGINGRNVSTVSEDIKKQGVWSTGRLVIGIISCLLFVFVTFQSCAVGLVNTIDETGEVGGSAGVIVAICILIAGIVGICTRNARGKSGAIVGGIFYFIGAFFSMAAGSTYGDLPIWGFISFVFGVVFIIAGIKTKKVM